MTITLLVRYQLSRQTTTVTALIKVILIINYICLSSQRHIYLLRLWNLMVYKWQHAK